MYEKNYVYFYFITEQHIPSSKTFLSILKVFFHSEWKVPTFRTLRSVKIYFPRINMKNIIRNLAEGVPSLVSIATLASLGS